MPELTEDALVELTGELVGYPSVNPPGREGDVATFLEGRLEDSPVGFDVETEDVFDGRPNVIARAGDPDRGSLLLTGHVDVVPAVPEDWTGDPFELRRDGDRIVGRGTSDMKGALAAKLLAAESYLERDDAGEVVLGFVVDEEQGGTGTEAMVEGGVDADAAILGEPTGLQVGIAQYGVVSYTITVRGRQAHAGRPDRGVNAINGMSRVVSRLEDLQAEQRREEHDLMEPGASITVTEIEGGIASNVVPDAVTATVNWRILPGAPADRAHYDGLLSEALDGITVDGDPVEVEYEFGGSISGVELSPDERIVRTVLGAGGDVGIETGTAGFNAASDARLLVPAGIPTVLFGPGSIEENAHTVDESIRADDLVATARVYERACERFLG